ncbi:hypothetical protein SAMN05216267_1006121 [Actinacidiphila rubida]|uniref:Lipoprotein n=1 Tax=Actinacidiphila rubida TaxID=310780 RepID=A0A1H8H930_9ACTN|nr:hypothetical protein [Actinacidiphila rubida]SEN52549.1 hypothetical protein SAMN05216267_1006121 [Actinacidiphila rubida]
MTPGRRTLAAALAVPVTGALLSGCLGLGGGDPDAGTNGVGKLPAQTIEARAKAAATSAHTVRLSGTVVSVGQTYRLDMRLSDSGGIGEVTTKGSTFELLRVGQDLYLKAGSSFYGGSDKDSQSAAAKLDGKFVKVPTGDPAYRQFSGLTDKKLLLGDLFLLDGSVSVGSHGKVGDVKTVTLNGSKGGALDVSLSGTPYPLRYQRVGNAGTLTLSDWGQDFTLAAPAKDAVVDYGSAVGATATPKPSK